jgi:hypothetical protein
MLIPGWLYAKWVKELLDHEGHLLTDLIGNANNSHSQYIDSIEGVKYK